MDPTRTRSIGYAVVARQSSTSPAGPKWPIPGGLSTMRAMLEHQDGEGCIDNSTQRNAGV